MSFLYEQNLVECEKRFRQALLPLSPCIICFGNCSKDSYENQKMINIAQAISSSGPVKEGLYTLTLSEVIDKTDEYLRFIFSIQGESHKTVSYFVRLPDEVSKLIPLFQALKYPWKPTFDTDELLNRTCRANLARNKSFNIISSFVL